MPSLRTECPVGTLIVSHVCTLDSRLLRFRISLSERQSRTSEFRNLDTRSVCAALSYSNKRLLLFFRGVSIYTVKLSFHVMTGLRGMKKRKGLECSVRLCDAATQVFLFLYRK
jgi:hypothetical protein